MAEMGSEAADLHAVMPSFQTAYYAKPMTITAVQTTSAISQAAMPPVANDQLRRASALVAIRGKPYKTDPMAHHESEFGALRRSSL